MTRRKKKRPSRSGLIVACLFGGGFGLYFVGRGLRAIFGSGQLEWVFQFGLVCEIAGLAAALVGLGWLGVLAVRSAMGKRM
jgi:hypothetical protein